ncbi:MAG: permease-like cell division protein FtsX [Patescibacteria group bacterium]|nr:ABC transporter permease [Patescibacteria group bacterium]MBU1877059.1 ABC transporter permease [Patescibacteria group bacterium]
MITSLKRIFKLGWKSLSYDWGVTATTIFVLVLTVSLITSIFLLKGVSQFLIQKIEEKIDISVYFKDDIVENKIMEVRDELLDISDAENIQYISKDQALQDFTERHEQEEVLMQSLAEVGVNPFLASINIKATDPTEYGQIAQFLETGDFGDSIQKVDYYEKKPVIERIFNLADSFKRVGIGLSILLVFFSFLVVLNTTRLAIYNLREEIQVQRLVGASNWFIRGPFLVQGMIAGAVSALIAFVIFISGCWLLSPNVSNLFSDLNVWEYFTGNLLSIILIQLGAGIFLGLISSFIAIRKHLKV